MHRFRKKNKVYIHAYIAVFVDKTAIHDDVIKWKLFRVTDPLCGEFTGPRAKARDASFDIFFDLCLNKQLSKQLQG